MATSDQGPQLYMECAQYGDARDLFNFIHNRNMEGDQLQSCQSFYINQMMASVTQLHNLNIAHLDLKPENFVVMSNGSLKLIDFGFSALSQSTLDLSDYLPPYCCTPGYDAPETKDYPETKTEDFNFNFEDLQKIDFWAIGAIIAFDLMVFKKERSYEMYKKKQNIKDDQVNKVNAQRLTSISLSLKDWFFKWLYDQGHVSTQGVIKQLIKTLVAEKEKRGSQISSFYIENAEGLYNI